MKILHVNKFLYRRGGAEGYMEDLAALQKSAGHEVGFFAMSHPQNDPSPYSASFPPHIELEPAPPSLAGKLKGAGRMLWSTSAKRGMAEVLEAFRPDVVHLHNIYHQLSPSILRPLASRGIPAVMTLHDYKLACPSYQFLDHGAICEACIGGRFRNAALRRCKDDSFTASALLALELALHTRFKSYAPVQRFICPSHFLASKMAQAGVFPERMRTVNHFVDATEYTTKTAPGGDVLFAGRLSPEKGVDVAIEALAHSEVLLDVAGDGPERERLEALAARIAPGRVRFHGRLPKQALHDMIRSSAAVVMPSRWYENQPMIILEAYACGVPVIGTNLGGTPELVRPGVTGELVPANDAAALGSAMQRLADDPAATFTMGRHARAVIDGEFTPDGHLGRIHEIYDEAIEEIPRGKRAWVSASR